MNFSLTRTPATGYRLMAFVGGGFLFSVAALWLAGQFVAAAGFVVWLVPLLVLLSWPLGFWKKRTFWLWRVLVLVFAILVPPLALVTIIAILCTIGPDCM